MQSDIRECASQLRQIESANYQAAMERASREIQHDNYRLARTLEELGLDVFVDGTYERMEEDVKRNANLVYRIK